MSDDIKRIDIKEWRAQGYLQEVNRLFFHPLGLALEVVTEDCGKCEGAGQDAGTPCDECGGDGKTERLGGIWDEREDPEGFLFGPGELDPEKIEFVKAEFEKRMGHRETLLAPGRNFQFPGDNLETEPDAS